MCLVFTIFLGVLKRAPVSLSIKGFPQSAIALNLYTKAKRVAAWLPDIFRLCVSKLEVSCRAHCIDQNVTYKLQKAKTFREMLLSLLDFFICLKRKKKKKKGSSSVGPLQPTSLQNSEISDSDLFVLVGQLLCVPSVSATHTHTHTHTDCITSLILLVWHVGSLFNTLQLCSQLTSNVPPLY